MPKKRQRSCIFSLFVLAPTLLLISQFIVSAPWAAGDWAIASNCFNNHDYRCAFAEAQKLALDGRIMVGSDAKTTDSMTFYQMAMIEYLAGASFEEKADAANFTITVFGRIKRRLPFSVELGFLSARHAAENNEDAIELGKLICRSVQETPPPSWRKLKGVNTLSSGASLYLEELMKSRPKC